MVEFSSRFQNDQQLKRAAEHDPAHVGEQFNREGNHVRLIKEALNAWAAKQNASLGLQPLPVTNVFDKATGDRVALYKRMQVPPILNFENKIDRIVGKKTVVALDKELPKLDEKPEVAQIADIVVRYQGAGDDRELTADEVLPEKLLITYLRKHLVKQDRVLHRFGNNTNFIGQDAAGMIARHVAKIEKLLEGKDSGKLCLWGSSSGGRNILDLALALTRRGLPLAYVGVLDAAFFPNDTSDVPTLTTKPTPRFRMYASVRPDRSLNVFQTTGNRKKITKNGNGFAFTSNLGGSLLRRGLEEIHGSVPPLRDRDDTFRVPSGASDDDAHGIVIGANNDEVRLNIATILNGA